MDQLPAKSDVREFRAYLDANDYNEQALQARIGTAFPPQADNEHRLAYVSREATTQNALVRLFLLGASLDQAAASEILSDSFIKLCIGTGLVDDSQGRLRSNIVIVCIEDLLIASDAFRILGSDQAADFVLPASTHSANYLRRLTMRQNLGSMLDLGCGCGVHALFASRHAQKVVATDISPAATRYTTFNAWLNDIDNIECIVGDQFAPLQDQSFDLIVSNPPFVLGPDDSFIYRDNQLELDEFCKQLVLQAPDFLNNNGHLQMLCETVEFEPDSWQERMKSWFGGTRCDAWVLHSPALHPIHYVSRRASDLSGGKSEDASGIERWVEYFEARKVSAIHPVMIVMRRRDGDNWVHVHSSSGNAEDNTGEAVRKSIAACDSLERYCEDAALLGATLTISPGITLEQQFERQDGLWQPRSSLMRTNSGLPMDAEVDMPILAFLNQIDGEKSLQAVIDEFGKAVGADVDKLTTDLLPVIRTFIARGFLEPGE